MRDYIQVNNQLLRFSFSFLFLIIVSINAYCQSQTKLDSLRNKLENIFKLDQSPRYTLDSIQKKYGPESPEVKSCWNVINYNDSINQVSIANILAHFGWLSAKQTSKNANEAIFLVIQHAPLSFQKKYLPKLLSAIKSGAADKSEYAFLSDRIRMREDNYQIYGTQISGDYKGNLCFWPIYNEPGVNKRRQQLGLNRIEEYAKDFELEYRIPIIDSLRGNSIINGYVADKKGKHLVGVKVFCNHKLLSTSNSDGIFKILISNKLKNTFLVLEKTGYQPLRYSLVDFKTDILYHDFTLESFKALGVE